MTKARGRAFDRLRVGIDPLWIQQALEMALYYDRPITELFDKLVPPDAPDQLVARSPSPGEGGTGSGTDALAFRMLFAKVGT